MGPSEVEPGWYPDPLDERRHRWWDGTGWTDHLHHQAAALEPETTPRRRFLLVGAVVVVALVGALALWRIERPDTAPRVAALASGDLFTCALGTGGTVSCWGSGEAGSLGPHSTAVRASRPVEVLGGAVTISAGGTRACAILHGGRAVCWGAGSRSIVPVPVRGVESIATTSDHTCAVISASVRCWGSDDHGQLGPGVERDVSRPVVVPGLAGVRSVAVGDGFSCALAAGGRVSCWGDNRSGQLGTPDLTASRPGPEAVPGIDGAELLVAGDDHACVTIAAGAVSCWGRGDLGQLGRGSVVSPAPPSPVIDLRGVTALVASRWATCAIGPHRAVSCWGEDTFGQLGDGSRSDPRLQPVTRAGSASVAISLGAFHSCAVSSAGQVTCFGGDSSGQLGDGGGVDSERPVRVLVSS